MRVDEMRSRLPQTGAHGLCHSDHLVDLPASRFLVSFPLHLPSQELHCPQFLSWHCGGLRFSAPKISFKEWNAPRGHNGTINLVGP